jgi:hypothetical protein
MGSVLPFFRNRGFDDEATEALRRAYDIPAARFTLRLGHLRHRNLKKIIEAAQHGECDPDRLAAIALE